MAKAWKSFDLLLITRDAASIAACHSFRRQWESADSIRVEAAGGVRLAWSRGGNAWWTAKTRPRLATTLITAV